MRATLLIALMACLVLMSGTAVADDLAVYPNKGMISTDGNNLFGINGNNQRDSKNCEAILTTNPPVDLLFVRGAYAADNVNGNRVIINGGSIQQVYGAQTNGNGKYAINNTVNINGGEITAYVYGGYANSNVSSNIVTINAGSIKYVYGGYAVNGNATGNAVIINGGIISATVYAGNAGKDAIYNTVVLGNGLSGETLNTDIWGGRTLANGDAVTGNTLEVWAKDLKVQSVQNFQNYYFILPSNIKSGDTVLTVDDNNTSVSTPTHFPVKANIGVAMASGAKLNKGDKVTLIKNADGFTGEGYKKDSLNGKTIKGTGGVSLKYDFALSDTPTTIDATVTSTGVNEQAKAIVEARAASVGIANAGADLVAGQAMHNALTNTAAAKGLSAGDGNEGVSIAPFAAVSGGTQRLETGSYVDVSGVAAALGLAARKDFAAAALTGGVFFEFGTSRFNTHNSFDTGDVDGTGHANYKGGGLLARLDITESLLKGLYLEGVFRFGGMTSDWHSDDLRDAATGRRASYDMYSPYTGAHLGLGYVWQTTDTFKVDFYGKWLWTRVYGDSVHVIDDPYTFEDVDSYRLRFGARADWDITEQFGLYAGAAWEHEFDGKARATAYGLDTPAPSVKGDTGVFDFGFSLKPSAVPGLTMELGATATAGIRHGIMGNMMVKYEF